MQKRNDKYLLKSSILYGFLGMIVLTILGYVLLILTLNPSLIRAIAFFRFGSLIIFPISFFCFVFSVRFFYLYYKLNKNNEVKSQRFVSGLFVISLLFLIFSVGFLWYVYSIGQLYVYSIGQLKIGSEVIHNSEKAEVFFEKAVQEKDYETILTLINFEASFDNSEVVRKVYNYAKENKEELNSVSYWGPKTYYEEIMTNVPCRSDTPIDIIEEIYKNEPEYVFDSCIANNENLPEYILRDIIKRYENFVPDRNHNYPDVQNYEEALENLRSRGLEE